MVVAWLCHPQKSQFIYFWNKSISSRSYQKAIVIILDFWLDSWCFIGRENLSLQLEIGYIFGRKTFRLILFLWEIFPFPWSGLPKPFNAHTFSQLSDLSQKKKLSPWVFPPHSNMFPSTRNIDFAQAHIFSHFFQILSRDVCLALLAVLAQIHVVYLKAIVTMMMNALAVFYVEQITVFVILFKWIHLMYMMTAAMTLF